MTLTEMVHYMMHSAHRFGPNIHSWMIYE